MSALTPVQKERQRFARSRAGRIREGIHNYLETLGAVALAYAERDWEALGYDGWDAYVDGEFGAERLRLSPEHRQKAVVELRLAGLSTRAIGSAVGVDQRTVRRDLASGAASAAPEPVQGIDGKAYSPARPPLVEALTGAIEDAAERAQDHPSSSLTSTGEAEVVCPTPAAEGATANASSAQDHRAWSPGEEAGPVPALDGSVIGDSDPSSPEPEPPSGSGHHTSVTSPTDVCPTCLRPLPT